MQIDATFGFAFLDVEVAFEIVVFCLFRDFSKRAQANQDFSFGSPMEMEGTAKTYIGAGEINPRGIGRGIEIRRVVETVLVKSAVRSKVRPENVASPSNRARSK